MPELLPLMNIDFTPHRLKAGDTIEFITKMNTMQELIEAWGLNLGTYGELIDALLVQARNVPEETRNALLDLVARAEAARSGMENALSGANLPVLTTDSAGKALIVKPDLSGYTFAALGTGGNEAIEADAIETTRSKRFISDTEKGYLAALIQLNTQVYPVWAGSQTAVTPVTAVRPLEGAIAITLTGSNVTDGAAVTVTTHFPSPLQIGESYPFTWGGDEGTLTLSEASKLTLAGASFGDNTLLSVLAKFPSGDGARAMDNYAGANWEDLYRGLYAAFRPGNETHQLLTDGERTSGLPASGSVWVENTQGWARVEVMSVAAGEYVKDTTVPRDLGALLVKVDLTANDDPKYAARRGLSAPGNHSAVGLFRLVEGHSPAELDQSGGLLGTPNGFWRAELMFSDTSRVVVDLCSKGVYVYAKGNDPFTLMGCEILIPTTPAASGASTPSPGITASDIEHTNCAYLNLTSPTSLEGCVGIELHLRDREDKALISRTRFVSPYSYGFRESIYLGGHDCKLKYISGTRFIMEGLAGNNYACDKVIFYPAGNSDAPAQYYTPGMLLPYDSGWFTVGLGQTHQLTHNLGRIGRASVLIRGDDDREHPGGQMIFNAASNIFYGTALEAITETKVTLKTGDGAIWHGVGIGNRLSSGYARVIID